MPPIELVTAIELRRALIGTLEQLAPCGSARSVPCNIFCDRLVQLIADILAATQPGTAEEIDRLTYKDDSDKDD
jgi:hypothetical protein